MKVSLLIIGLYFLAGCATVPANFGKPTAGSKIGIVILIDESPNYSHIGTTIFSNEQITTSSDTNYQEKFSESISKMLLSGGHSPKRINASELLVTQRDSLFSYMSSNVNFKDNIKTELNKLATEEGLDYLVLVYPNSGPAWPNSAAYLSGYGLYTRCFFGTCNAYALDYVGARIFDVKNNSSLKPMEFTFFSQQALPDIAVPDDANKITQQDIDKAATVAKEKIIIQIEKMLKKSEFI